MSRGYSVGAGRADKQVDWSFRLLYLNPPGRRQTKKFRPEIRLTDNLSDWLLHWKSSPQKAAPDENGFSAPMIWDGKPVTTMKKTFKRHAVDCGFDQFTQDTIQHFMATHWRRAKPPVSKEQRDIWLGHNDQRTARWYEHRDPKFLEDARRATDSIIDELQNHTKRLLSARKLRAKASIHLVSSKTGSA